MTWRKARKAVLRMVIHPPRGSAAWERQEWRAAAAEAGPGAEAGAEEEAGGVAEVPQQAAKATAATIASCIMGQLGPARCRWHEPACCPSTSKQASGVSTLPCHQRPVHPWAQFAAGGSCKPCLLPLLLLQLPFCFHSALPRLAQKTNTRPSTNLLRLPFRRLPAAHYGCFLIGWLWAVPLPAALAANRLCTLRVNGYSSAAEAAAAADLCLLWRRWVTAVARRLAGWVWLGDRVARWLGRAANTRPGSKQSAHPPCPRSCCCCRPLFCCFPPLPHILASLPS